VTTPPKEQRRGRTIAMTPDERDAFLTEQRTCRVATVSPDGPHVTPLWYLWDGAYVWLYSIVRSQRWTDLARDPRIGIVIDSGEDYFDLHGVEITGAVEIVGEVPRTGEPEPALTAVEQAFARKYQGVDDMVHDNRHGWLRVVPRKISSWDFRKIANL
jgi:Pyridoxamine 5'-phosphate oxidase